MIFNHAAIMQQHHEFSPLQSEPPAAVKENSASLRFEPFLELGRKCDPVKNCKQAQRNRTVTHPHPHPPLLSPPRQQTSPLPPPSGCSDGSYSAGRAAVRPDRPTGGVLSPFASFSAASPGFTSKPHIPRIHK